MNNLDAGDLPEDGQPAPESEGKRRVRRRRTNKGDEGSRKVIVQRLATIVYVMTDTDGHKYASSTNQTMAILGEMTLEDALKIANTEFKENE